MNREQKENALVVALNKATKSQQGFFLYSLSFYALGPGKIRDLIMKLDDEEFEVFYPDALSNLEPAPTQEAETRDTGKDGA
jgi:hypothetical protein